MASTESEAIPVAVTKPNPLTFDLGLLICNDQNVLSLPSDPAEIESVLAQTARDGAQALVNQLLTVCPLTSTQLGVMLTLPAPHTPLPREKPVPEERPQTKWERFAAKKGIKPKTREARKNLAYDEESGEWRPRWGKDGLNKKGEDDWLVEVDPEKDQKRAERLAMKTGSKGRKALLREDLDSRGLARRERKERVRRNDRRMRKNMRDADEAKKSKS